MTFLKWKGIYVDAALRAASPVTRNALHVAGERQKTFMTLSALQGSVLEHRVLEDDWQVEFISTAKMMQIVDTMQLAPEIITVDRTNLNVILPALPFDDGIKEDISNAVNQNLTVRIPTQEIAYKDWTGIGYLKENPVTGEAGYMLSGMIAGSLPAESPEKWANQYLMQILKGQYAGQFNKDPLAAAKIIKIPVTDGREGTVGQPHAQPFAVLVTDKKGVPVLGAKVKFIVEAGGGNFGSDAGGQPIIVFEATTGNNGIAKSNPFILGKKTSDNPTEYWKTGYTYYQQVGLNLVDASLSSGISISSPFTAYGFPDDPKSFKKLHGDGETEKWGLILNFKGFISLIIQDQYENPIANLPVTFQALAAKANDDPPNCADRYLDTLRGTLLTKAGDPCIKNAPIYDDKIYDNCPSASSKLDVVTNKQGAIAEVILGGTPDAIYPITATCTHPKCSNVSPTTFNLYTYYHDDCSLTDAPKAQLFTTYVYSADSFGNNINAGKTGTVIPVQARLTYLKETSKEANETLSCDSGTKTCKKIVGDRSYSAGSDFASSSATFAGIQGESRGNGIFASTYKLAPGLNQIQIKGNGTITDRRSYNSCSGCSVDDSATINLSQSMAIMKVFGVDIAVDSPPMIRVDESGLAQDNYDITYAITPAEYRAATAYLFIYKEGDPNPWWFMANALQGTGTATIDKGFPFDVNSKYEAEIVLNYGTGVEIRSGRIPLKLLFFKITKPQIDEKILIKNDAGGNPKMPALTAEVSIKASGIDPAIIDNLPICWKAKVEYNVNITKSGAEYRSRKGLNCDAQGACLGKDGFMIPAADVNGFPTEDCRGKTYTIDWGTNFGGGTLDITARANIEGIGVVNTYYGAIQGQLFGQDTNNELIDSTFRTRVINYLEAPTGAPDYLNILNQVGYAKFFRILAYLETGLGAPRYSNFERLNGGFSGYSDKWKNLGIVAGYSPDDVFPVINKWGTWNNPSSDGGFGLMQLTNGNLPFVVTKPDGKKENVPSYEQIWNWKKNVEGGVLIAKEKLGMATAWNNRHPVADGKDKEEFLRWDIYQLYRGGHFWRWVYDKKEKTYLWRSIPAWASHGWKAKELEKDIISGNPPNDF